MKRGILTFALGLVSAACLSAPAVHAQCYGGCCGGQCSRVKQQTFEAVLEVKVKMFYPFQNLTEAWQFGLPYGSVLLSVTDCKTGEERIIAEQTEDATVSDTESVLKPIPPFEETPANDSLFMNADSQKEPAEQIPTLIPNPPKRGDWHQ